MSAKTQGPSPEHTEPSSTSIGQTPPAVTETPFLHIEIESGSGVFGTHLAINTNWVLSVVPALIVANLNLKCLPMTPPLRQRPFQTPDGLRYLKEYVPMWVRAPWLGLNHGICVNIGVLDPEDSGKDAALYVGANLWKKITQKSQTETLNLVAKEQLEPDKHLSALPPEDNEETLGRMESPTTPRFADAASPCPQTLRTGADEVDLERSPDTDRSRLTPHGPENPRSATSRLDSTSLFTNRPTSTAPSTQELGEPSAASTDAASPCYKVRLATNHPLDDIPPMGEFGENMADA